MSDYMSSEDQLAIERAKKWLRDNPIGSPGREAGAAMVPEAEYDENGELLPVEDQGGALSSVVAQETTAGPVIAGLPTVQDLYGQQAQLGNDLSAFWQGVQKDRQAQYEQATELLKQRRFGPSRAEQLFQLAAAIGKPTLNRSFGSIMANVTPALGEIAQANREAAEQRSAAAQALREKYLSDLQGTQFNVLQQRQKNISALTPLAVAQARGAAPKVRTGFNPVTGELVNMDTGEPVGQQNLQTLTPQQVAELSRNPANRGKRFRTTDGRIMEIK